MSPLAKKLLQLFIQKKKLKNPNYIEQKKKTRKP